MLNFAGARKHKHTQDKEKLSAALEKALKAAAADGAWLRVRVEWRGVKKLTSARGRADKALRDTLLKTAQVTEDWESALVVGCHVRRRAWGRRGLARRRA